MADGCSNKKANSFLLVCMFLVFSLWLVGCRENMTGTNVAEIKFVKDEDINDSNFRQIGEGYSFNIKFKNVWIDYEDLKGKLIKVPIFQGVSGDVKLSQLEKKRKVKEDITILGSLRYSVRKGEVKKTILECVNFYKDSLFKNIDYRKPTIIGGEETSLIIWYDFDYEGYQSSIMIFTGRDTKCKKCLYRYIDDIEIDENVEGFILKIRIGSKSPFFDEREEIEKGWEEYLKNVKK